MGPLGMQTLSIRPLLKRAINKSGEKTVPFKGSPSYYLGPFSEPLTVKSLNPETLNHNNPKALAPQPL